MDRFLDALVKHLIIIGLILLCASMAPAQSWVQDYQQAARLHKYDRDTFNCKDFAALAVKVWRARPSGTARLVTLACTGTRNPDVVRKRHVLFVVDDGPRRWCVSNDFVYQVSQLHDLGEAWNFSYFSNDGFGSCWDVEKEVLVSAQEGP